LLLPRGLLLPRTPRLARAAAASASRASLARDPAEKRLQVTGFLDRRVQWMIERLVATMDHLHKTASGAGRRLDQPQQLVRAQMIWLSLR
jgi:hypothetical protein